MSLSDDKYDAELAATMAWVRSNPGAAAKALVAYRHWQGDKLILSYAHTLVSEGVARFMIDTRPAELPGLRVIP